MLIKSIIALFLIQFLLIANASLPDHINALVFDQSGFKKNLIIRIPPEDSRKLLEEVQTTDYSALRVKPFVSSKKVNPIFLQYLVKNQYAEIIHEDWKSRGSRNPMYFLFYTDELFKKLPDVRECNQTWCVHIGNRELVSIEYTNSYKGNVFGYETDVYAVVFKYKLTSSLPHLTPSTILYTGKAKAYLDLDDGAWKLINFELEDKEEKSILNQMSNDYPEFEFNVQNTLVKTSVTDQIQEQKTNESPSAVKHQDPIETFNNAMVIFENHNFEKAALLFTKAIDSRGLTGVDELIAYMKRGEAHEKLEEVQKAINDYSVALEKLKSIEGLNDYKAEFYYRRGYLNEQLDQKQQALSDYTSAIEIDSNYLRAFNNRANLYFEFENYEQAIQDLDKYIEGDERGWPQAYYVRGMAKLILEQHEESVRDLRIAASLGYKDAQTALDQQDIQWQGAYSIYSINSVLDQCENIPEESTRLVIILANKTESMKSLKALGILGEKFVVVSNDSMMEDLSNGGLILDERRFDLTIGNPESYSILKTISGTGFAHADFETELDDILIDLVFDNQAEKQNLNDASVFSVVPGQCMILNLVDLQFESDLPQNSDKINTAQEATLFDTENVPGIHSQPLHFEHPNLAFESTFDQGLIDVIKQSSQSQANECKAEIANQLWSLEKFELSENEASLLAQQLSISSPDDVMADKLETELLYELSMIILKQPERDQVTVDFTRSVMGYLMGKLITSSYLEGKSLNEHVGLETTVDLEKAFEQILAIEQLKYFVLDNIAMLELNGNAAGDSNSKYQAKIKSVEYFYNPFTHYLVAVIEADCVNENNNVFVLIGEIEALKSRAILLKDSFENIIFKQLIYKK